MAHACRFLGHRNGVELINLFKISDAICVLSRNEPFGLAVLEAWAAGKHVVASSSSGPGEFVWHEVNGLKIYPGPKSIAWGLGTLFTNFDWARRWAGLEALIELAGREIQAWVRIRNAECWRRCTSGSRRRAARRSPTGSGGPRRRLAPATGFLNARVEDHLGSGQPVISVDTKKKELVGTFAYKGKEWQPKGEPEEVEVHDVPDPEVGKAIPYGVYDLGANEGWVSVGDDNDIAAFAVATIGRWWDMVGSVAYPGATRLLITADAGGSNGYRNRLWKRELSTLAARSGMGITGEWNYSISGRPP
ncbi:MAG: glycosyltransferase [Actinobacteria bacterium]|nr:MAG: glycosyltransferase [Actinomycetota bacterium]